LVVVALLSVLVELATKQEQAHDKIYRQKLSTKC